MNNSPEYSPSEESSRSLPGGLDWTLMLEDAIILKSASSSVDSDWGLGSYTINESPSSESSDRDSDDKEG